MGGRTTIRAALGWLAPDLESPDRLASSRAAFSLVVSAMIAFGGLFLLIALITPSQPGFIPIAITAMAGALAILILLRRRSPWLPHFVCLAAFATVSAGLFLRGGLGAPATAALGTIPLIGLCYFGPRAAIAWTGAVLLEIVIYGALAFAGIELPDYAATPTAEAARVVTPFVTVLVYVALVLTYDRMRTAATIQRDRAERAREKAQAEAAMLRADRMASIGQLAAGVAHEVNNPMSYVLANLEYLYGQLLQDDVTATELSDMRSALEDAMEGAHRVKAIVADLRAFSRRDEESIHPVDMRAVVESALKMAGSQIRYRAQLTSTLATVPAVMADEGRLLQVALNLLVNAAHAIPEAAEEPHEISVRLEVADGGSVLLEIRDTGSGIAPEHLEEVFTPFFTTKPADVGTGLGLSVCRRIVRSYGGELTLSSQVGHGTTARVRLPVAPSTQPRDRAPRRASLKDEPARRVLIIDDDPMVRAAIVRTLRAHSVVSVASGVEALEVLEHDDEFDIILCDLHMPEMSGQELFARLERRRDGLAAHVVFLTGACSPDAERFLENTGNRWLQKPFVPLELQQVVANA